MITIEIGNIKFRKLVQKKKSYNTDEPVNGEIEKYIRVTKK